MPRHRRGSRVSLIARLRLLVIAILNGDSQLFAHPIDRLTRDVIRSVRNLAELGIHVNRITQIVQIGVDRYTHEILLCPAQDQGQFVTMLDVIRNDSWYCPGVPATGPIVTLPFWYATWIASLSMGRYC
jgi:hypothetical protein